MVPDHVSTCFLTILYDGRKIEGPVGSCPLEEIIERYTGTVAARSSSALPKRDGTIFRIILPMKRPADQSQALIFVRSKVVAQVGILHRPKLFL